MTQDQWRFTRSILLVLRSMERTFTKLKDGGVTVLALEEAKVELINTILECNGVSKTDEAVCWLIEPIISFIEDQRFNEKRCMEQLAQRFYELREQRRRSKQAVGEAAATS